MIKKIDAIFRTYFGRAYLNYQPFYDISYYYINGDGIYKDSLGTILYIKNKLLHRENGAAIIYANGKKEYRLFGRNYAFQDYYERQKTVYGPEIISEWLAGNEKTA